MATEEGALRLLCAAAAELGWPWSLRQFSWMNLSNPTATTSRSRALSAARMSVSTRFLHYHEGQLDPSLESIL
jgi:hypothetical protein